MCFVTQNKCKTFVRHREMTRSEGIHRQEASNAASAVCTFKKTKPNKNGAVEPSLAPPFAGFPIASKHVSAAFLRSGYPLWEFTLKIKRSLPDPHSCFDSKTLSSWKDRNYPQPLIHAAPWIKKEKKERKKKPLNWNSNWQAGKPIHWKAETET